MVIWMEISELKKMIESVTKKKIIKISVVAGGNKIKKHHFKVTLSDGTSLLLKKCIMSQHKMQCLMEVRNKGISNFQRILAIYPVTVNEYYMIMEWKEGVLLCNCVGLFNRCVLDNYLRETAIALRHIHESTRMHEKVCVTPDYVNEINSKDYLTCEQKKVMVQYITSNLWYLNNRHVSIVHGDVHLANILVSDGKIVFLDLDDAGYGDPYRDLVYAANLHHSRNELQLYYLLLKYYFDNNVPKEFWRIVNVYSLIKAMSIIESEIRDSETHVPALSMSSVLSEHDNLTHDEPNWYISFERG